MRHLLYIALFLLYCTFGCFAAVVQQLPQKGQSALQTYTVSLGLVTGGSTATITNGPIDDGWKPIRIAVYTKYVEDVMMHCINKTKPANNMQFSDLLCDGPNKMTTERMNTLFGKVLPEAIKLHSDRLKVKPVTGKLKVEIRYEDGEEEAKRSPAYRRCKGTRMPEEHFNEGVDNADFLLYVVVGTSHEETSVCSEDREGRPTSGIVRFVPKEISATRQYIRRTAHEIAHALGFTTDYMNRNLATHRGSILMNDETKWLVMVQHDDVKQRLKEHYNCNNFEGIVLDQEESRYFEHWEQRIARDELMSPYTGEPTGMFYTAITLAAFNAMPYYQCNFSMAESMSWGNQSKCDFIRRKCTEIIGDSKFSNVFCKENEGEKTLQCTSDRFALGVCSKDDKNKHGMPEEYNYFQTIGKQTDLMKGCPIIKPFKETTCEAGNETLMPGSIVSNMSRCLGVKDLKFNEGHAGNGVTVQGICAKVKCEDGKVKVQYKGQSETEWYVCGEDGNEIKPQNSVFKSVTIMCPKYEEVCKGLSTTPPPIINYTEIVWPEPKAEEVEVSQMEPKEEKSSVGTVPAAQTQTGKQGRTSSPTTGGKGSSQRSSTEARRDDVGSQRAGEKREKEEKREKGEKGEKREKGEKGDSAPRRRRSTEDAASSTSPSTSNPKGNDNTVPSPDTANPSGGDTSSQTIIGGASKGTNLTEDQIKKIQNNTNIMLMVAPDSSIMVSYMVSLAFLVCAVGFVMVP